MSGIQKTLTKSIILIFCFCIFFGSFNAAAAENSASSANSEGKIIQTDISAPSLAGNVIGESEKQPVSIYLPPSYDSKDKSYPVVYFLHGWAEELKQYREGPYFKMKEIMDKLINEKKCEEMIVVMSNGCTKYMGSFYTNSTVTGNWEDYFVKDVVGYVDTNYRTIKDVKARGIGGFSMGGYGALNLSMKHPETFGSVYALSPGLFDANGLSTWVMFENDQTIKDMLKIEKEYDSKPLAEGRKELYENISQWKLPFQFILGVSYGTCFSPNPDKVVPFNYPYKLEGDKLVLDKAVWEKWESGFGGIKDEVIKYKDNMLKLGEIRIDYGVNDENKWIPNGCRYFVKELKKQGIPYTLLTFDGSHESNVSERIEKFIMPYFSNRFFSAPTAFTTTKSAPEEYRLGSWSKEQINTLWEKDMGDPNIFADYNSNITREEFAMLSVMLAEKFSGSNFEAAEASTFSDISQSRYSQEILKAYKLGICKGTGNSIFNPKGNITRQEIAVMLLNTLKAVKPAEVYKTISKARFSDEDKIASWAKDAHAYMYENGIITGTDNLVISPLNNTTKQEALVMVYRMAKQLEVIK